MRKIIKKNEFVITENKAFAQVIYNCKNIDRNDGFGTWITYDMEQAYINLHKKGLAKSVEVWKDNQLVGGLYGVDLNTGIFFGESMFSKMSNASKYGFITLIQENNYRLIDCQIHSNHLESLGAKHISRDSFLTLLNEK